MRINESLYTWQCPPGQVSAVQYAAEFQHPRTQASGKVIHPWWVLDYNFTPGERVRVHSVNAPWIERPANVVHLYAPGVPYWEDVGRDGRPVYVHCAYVLFADPGLLRLDALFPTRLRVARFFDDQGIVGRLLREIVRVAVTNGEAGYWQTHARLFEILTWLHQAAPLGRGGDYRIQETPPSAAPPAFIQQVQRYMQAHLADPITIADLAAEAGMSASALAHRYRTATGETPMTTVKRARIDLAKGLLEKGYRLKEIARYVGFTDEFHLSKAFKQLAGLSPRAYRQR